tara:strand:+ start:2129 stop:2956 length:828 start_codon:yes stop_codon:yes gene_type:complete
MGKNKLAMVSNKTKKKKKKTIHKKFPNIIDVPLSDLTSLGSKASLGDINYHYQKYYNTFAFLKKVIQSNEHLKNLVCIPNVGSGWMESFLKVHFFKGATNVKSKLDSVKPVDGMVSKQKFIDEIRRCMNHRLIPINLEIVIPGTGTHSNIILIDTKKKTVELFEPHGARDNESELESISRAYFKVSRNVHKFFKLYFPEYRYIPPNKYEPEEGLQMKLDAFSGLCVTWSILYLHYRILNPDVRPSKLIEYLEYKITRSILLRYTRYVEEVLKGKV